MMRLTFIAAAAAILFVSAGHAMAKSCGNDAGGFQAWLSDFEGRAKSAGISQATLTRALDGVSYDRSVIRRDRSQKSFKLSFEQFYAKRVGPGLLNSARAKMKTHAGLLSKIEKRYGVPKEILVSIWGLETNFGRDGSGKYSIIQAIATLAYDCRRSEFFTGHLMAAMRIVQRGDMTPAQLRGGWAGEIGQVQFLPGSYDKYAVDFDGDGRRDLVRSVPDILASTANFMKGHGWQGGGSWQPGSANYGVIKDWNRAEVYARTISVMADRLQ
ncbi:MAG: lytic transglycosylase [Hyphomicrobium sp. 32-62-53]|nr:MAG: lytic transglycosylase [Hyphomicrobium sp. 12-62-95]OYY00538.1 MAG: lytic transglycosylase [Hyphomicrobium sp. 32-62-53]